MSHFAATAGRTARDENFPVGSWLLPAHLRPHVAAFYRFARTADDVADDPSLCAEEKHARLHRMEAALRDEADAGDDPDVTPLRRTLAETGLSADRPLTLLRAFHRDADNPPVREWDDLMAYCRLSAVPVGETLLDLHGEGDPPRASAAALCSALQVLNHLQDCRDDWRALNRLYLPLAWLEAEGTSPTVLEGETTPPPLRRVLDRMLDETQTLLHQAAPLPGLIRHGGLAREAGVVLTLAERLSERLRRQDPLAERVVLGAGDWAWAMGRGLWRAGWTAWR